MGADETKQEAVKRGQKEGRIDALLEEHGLHLERINGSVGDAAKALASLTDEVRTLSTENQLALRKVDTDLKEALRVVASDIRTLNEDQRIRDTALTVAAEGLAKQTEERREQLAGETGTFTRRQQVAALVVAIVTLAVATYFGTR